MTVPFSPGLARPFALVHAWAKSARLISKSTPSLRLLRAAVRRAIHCR